MNILFLMDPLESVVREKDTSYIFMMEAHKRGNKVFFLPDGGITRKNGKSFFHVEEVIPHGDRSLNGDTLPNIEISPLSDLSPFILKGKETLSEDDVDVVFVRSDPPFDSQYLMNMWLLDLLPKRIPVINKPSGIRTVNEKVWATQFTDIIPRTLISSNKGDYLEFLKEEKTIIVKPTGGFGGQSIFKVSESDVNANVVFETLVDNGAKEIIAQQYVSDADKGDKRIILLNGEPLGAVLRVHKQGEHRNNLFSGGCVEKCDITQRDLEIVEILKPYLIELGLYFVGIDIIGDYLIEVNVTSPTCVQEINRLYDLALEKDVIDFVENLYNGKCQMNK